MSSSAFFDVVTFTILGMRIIHLSYTFRYNTSRTRHW